MTRSFDTRLRILFAAIAVLALLGGPGQAGATVITVTTTADELNTDGDCSLREAFAAANLNSPRDACPAGSNTQGDEIVLVQDAVYSLTLPNDDAQGFSGSLVVNNNTATSDLKVSVAGTGTATVSQDAVPDTRVIVVKGSAHLDLEDVVIEGGSVSGTGNDSGGGILVASSAQLALLRCEMTGNVTASSGGAIRNQGTLIVEDSAFFRNIATVAGGAISNASNASTLVKGSFFADNESRNQFSGGGAIESSDQISIVGSSFVNNRAKSLGGAISHFDDVANRSSISQTCFVGNDADFAHDAVHVFTGSETLNAAGNWWGADDGASGASTGHGDGVSTLVNATAPNAVPFAACRPMEMVANGGFQSDGNADGTPERWTENANVAANDGRACNADGACVVKMRGSGPIKRLSQDIRHAGSAGDVFTFKARSRAQDVPASGGVYRVILTIAHTDGSKQSATLDFSPGKHGFERLNKQVTATESYKSMVVGIEYGRVSGVVRFDSIAVLLQ